MKPKSSITTEDYLKAIYTLAQEHETVSTSLLAERLQVKAASVSEMVKKMSERGLVSREPYYGIKLTENGKQYALRVVRKHRLWELYLYEVFDYSLEDIHDDAEHFEHIISNRLEAKLDAALNYPKFDPHGHPIPAADGTLPEEPESVRLSELPANQSAVVVQMHDFDAEFVKYILDLGIRLGEKIQLKEKRAFDGSMLISVRDKEWNISNRIAENILVQKTTRRT